jgi:hypothetical protein
LPFYLHENSPCAEENNPECGLIGRWPVGCGPAVFEVRADGTGDYPTIQAAIDAAPEGMVIELVDGTYTGDGNRDLDFGGKSVTVRSQSGDPSACVIDCQGMYGDPHRAFYFHSGENADAVVEDIRISGGYLDDYGPALHGAGIRCEAGSSPTIRNCVFLASRAADGFGGGFSSDATSAPHLVDCLFATNTSYAGGGAHCQGSGATFTGCAFENNTADLGGGLLCFNCSPALDHCSFTVNNASVGGGAYCVGEDYVPVFEVCSFTSNVAHYGGGMYLNGMDAQLTSCDFVTNTATTYDDSGGGGVCCINTARPVLTDCTFENNTASMGAGLCAMDPETHVTLIGCTLLENEAATGNSRGGGIYADGADVAFTETHFEDNAATYGGGICSWDEAFINGGHSTFTANLATYGGGYYVRQYSGYLNSCIFTLNTASQAGGAVYSTYSFPDLAYSYFSANSAPVGGAICGYNSDLYVWHSTFEGNHADIGAAMYWWECMPEIGEVTMVGNIAVEGGVIACFEFATPIIHNTIIASNLDGGAVYCANAYSVPTLTCCDIYDNAGGDWAGEIASQYGSDGNISEDPLFCGPANPDEPYTLNEDSPCAEENNPGCGQIGNWPIGCSGGSAVEDVEQTVTSVQLSAPYPNPASAEVRITFAIPAAADAVPVTLRVFDASGRLVRTLVNEGATAGFHHAVWDGRDARAREVGTGIYYCKLRVGDERITRRVTLVR